MIEILNPTFKPDLSKAKRVVGKASAENFRAVRGKNPMPLTIKILKELVDLNSTAPEMTDCICENSKSVASTLSCMKRSGYVDTIEVRSPNNQKMSLYTINEKGLKHLSEFNQRKTNETLPNVSRDSGGGELANLYVDKKTEVSQSA